MSLGLITACWLVGAHELDAPWVSKAQAWPAVGFAAGALSAFGLSLWPAVTAAIFLTSKLIYGSSATVWLATITGTAETLMGAWIMIRFRSAVLRRDSYRESSGAVLGGLAAGLVGCTIYQIFELLLETRFLSLPPITPWKWVATTALSVFILSPAALHILGRRFRALLFERRPLERIALYASCIGITYYIFFAQRNYELVFLGLPILIWAAARFGERDLRILSALFCVIAFWGATETEGPFTKLSPETQTKALYLFLFSVAVVTYGLSSFRKVGSLRYPASVLCVGWALTAGMTMVIQNGENQLDRERFDKISHRVIESITPRFKLYEDSLIGGVGLLSTGTTISETLWKNYVQTVNIGTRYPGIDGVGVVLRPPAANGAPGKYTVAFNEPAGIGAATLPIDVSLGSKIREAAELARDNGQMTIAQINTAEPYSRRGFLVLFPYYKTGPPPTSEAERKFSHLGWVFAHVDAQRFFQSALLSVSREADIYVFSGKGLSPANFIYGTNSAISWNERTLEEIRLIRIGQHDFTLALRRSKDFLSARDSTVAVVSLLGILASLLVAALISEMQSVSRRAESIAAEKTSLLAASELEVRQLNLDLERRVAERTKALEFANQSLTHSQARLTAIIDQSPFATQIISLDGRVTRLNKAWQHLWSISDQDVENYIYNEYNVFSDPIVRQHGLIPFIESALSGSAVMVGATRYDLRALGREGAPRWLEAYVAPIKAATGSVTEIILIFHDVTAQVQAQKAIRQKQEELETILDNSPAMIFMKDTEGRMIMVNREFEKVFGKSRQSILGKKDHELWAFDLAIKFRENDLRVLLRSESIQSTLTAPHQDGLHTYVSVKFPIFDARGEIRAVCCIATDITEQKRTEAEKALLEIRERSAVEASRLKSEFLANMSHEIRTPINAIIGMTRLLEDSELEGQQKWYVSSIAKSSGLLLTLINDILDLSKVEAGKLELELLIFNLDDLIFETTESFRPLMEARGLEFSTTVDIDGPRIYRGDPARIRQVLNNLIGNALKFTTKGRVDVHVSEFQDRASGGQIQFVVEDTGIGITPETVKRLFQNFSQGDSSTARKFGGTGLGLAISKRLTELMGGAIHVESGSAGGAKFIFSVKLEPVGVEAAMGATMSKKSPTTVLTHEQRGKERILVAEDNAINQEITIRMLERAGFTAEAVGSGIEVLAALRQKSYSLILMDCQMPEMDGYQASETLRGQGVEIPIIALTANAFKEDREKCLKSGMSDYIAKPVCSDTLIETIDHWIAENHPTEKSTRAAVTPKARSLVPNSTELSRVIDLPSLQRLTQIDGGGADGLAHRLIRLFINGLDDEIGLICSKGESGQYDDMKRTAHKLRSSSAQLGVIILVPLLETLEIGQWSSKDLPELLKQLRVRADVARQALTEIISKAVSNA